MKCVFVAMGAENPSIEALSAMLKKHGHQTALAYDQALFDDKNYLSKPRIAKFFDHRNIVLAQVLKAKPDLVAFSVMTPTYSWALEIARRIKEAIDVPIIFGGIHPTTCPEEVLGNDCVDIICKGEGDYALLELCDEIENNTLRYDIKNLWFKRDGKIVQNSTRPLIADLDSLPFPDKELFAPHINIKNSYLSVTSRGCPFSCSFCALSYYAEEAKQLGSKRLRERSVKSVIEELKINIPKYGSKWIEFRNNTFTAKRKWVLEFCEVYGREIGLPFLAFAHPTTMDIEVARAMKNAGCFNIQLGLESFDEWVRENILNRSETNAAVLTAVEAMDEVGLDYSLDYILGLPTQTEKELLDAAQFFLDRTSCHRISPYMLAYLPKLKIIEHGLKYGELTEEDVQRIEQGEHDHYLATGSIGEDKIKLQHYKAYKFLFRTIPLLGPSVGRFLLNKKRFLIFGKIPVGWLLDSLDILQAARRRDLLARTYVKNYAWWFLSRFRPSHPAYRWQTNPSEDIAAQGQGKSIDSRRLARPVHSHLKL